MMLIKKALLLTPIIIISAGMTACSGHESQKVTSIKKPIIKKAVITQQKENILPVVFEKRSPQVKKKRVPARKYYPRIARSTFSSKLSNAALGRLKSRIRYDGSYVKIGYPWGDVPSNIGVCTDVVIRSYRKLGIDLQQQVHQDMSRAFNTYPNLRKWGLSRPDTNIDHRRVYNLRKFFTRKGAALPISRNPNQYKPGDVVSWMVGPGLPHIGVVVNRRSKADPRRFMVVHNIANGPELEDMLFRFPITGHFRYTAAHARNNQPQTLYTTNRRKSRSPSQNDIKLLEAAATSLLASAPKAVKAKKKVSTTVLNTTKHNQKIVLANLSDLAVQELLKQ